MIDIFVLVTSQGVRDGRQAGGLPVRLYFRLHLHLPRVLRRRARSHSLGCCAAGETGSLRNNKVMLYNYK